MARRLGKVEYYGPFFERDPGKTLRQNMREASRQMAEAGVSMVRAQYAPGRGSALAETVLRKELGKEGLFHVLASSLSTEARDRSWVTWMEIGRRRAPGGGIVASPKFKGYRAWARVRSALRRQAKITADELLKGVT